MSCIPLFDTQGNAIAFLQRQGDKVVFNMQGRAIGGFVRDDSSDVSTLNGDYLGTVVGQHLVRLPGHFGSQFGALPSYSGTVYYDGPLHMSGSSSLPYGMYDDVPARYLLA